ncbi:MAG: fibronectin type III domain-containing protein, partial [Bacteroidales bacterium]|nr:fibronectin type III domain-containing protein [Bacteroidales bacterium]
MKNFYKIQILTVFVLLFSVLRLQAQDNPQSFTTQAISASQIDLSFQLNASNDPIVIAFNTSSSFGTPSGSYSVGDPISGGGTVIYSGTGSNFSHTTLFANTTYYYKAWSYNSTYSTGIADDEITKKAEPTYHPTSFAVSAKNSSSITLEWVDAIGISKPDAYLIKGSLVGFGSISNPVDGTEESESALVKIANYGDESTTFTGLDGNSTYYFKIFAYTNSGAFINYKTIGTIPSASETTDPTPAEIALSGSVNEGSENGGVITVSLTNDDFLAPLTPANWTINNLPSGVTIDSISRSNSTTVEITLQGNRTKDYDSDITNLEVTVAGAELSLNSTAASASSGFTFTATNDAESLTLDYDGTITEGGENGEIITINLTGGTFSSSINPANWEVSNLPTGVTPSSFVRNSATQVQFTLSGSATADYDENIDNMTVTCSAAEVDDHSGSNLTANTGVVFTATNDAETLSISYNSGSSISEGSENSKVIIATLSGGTFPVTIDKSNWTLNPLHQGVTIGSIYRNSSTEVEITLSGNRSVDYDTDILSTLTILASEFSDPGVSADLSSTNTVEFDADNDNETLTMNDDGTISEGAENGEIISVSLTGGTFANPLSSANWSFANLPDGVTIGSIIRVNATTVEITLSGNRTVDYDADITSATLTINQAEIDDYSSGDYVINTGITFTATDDAESISLSWASIPGTNGTEASLNNEIITLTLSGGTFVSSQINTTNITAEGTATSVGVSIESVTYISTAVVEVALAWNQTDFDSDKILTLKVAAAAYDLGTSELSDDITITATVEPATITLTDNTINEESESSGEIYITLTNDNFKISGADDPNNPANWTVSNLPKGVSKGDITVTSATTATIALDGNRSNDYDANITNVTVEIAADEFVSENNSANASTGVTLIANNDPESLAL